MIDVTYVQTMVQKKKSEHTHRAIIRQMRQNFKIGKSR